MRNLIFFYHLIEIYYLKKLHFINKEPNIHPASLWIGSNYNTNYFNDILSKINESFSVNSKPEVWKLSMAINFLNRDY
jgi:hypothetical protein